MSNEMKPAAQSSVPPIHSNRFKPGSFAYFIEWRSEIRQLMAV